MTEIDIEHQEPTKVALAGDWHGNARWAEASLEYAKRSGADAVIQLGDFGFWVPGPGTDDYLGRVHNAVRDLKLWFAWLPGNHEYWPGIPELGRGKRPSLIRGNLIYLPIGYRWQWWGKKWMAVGGAWSIDRFMRKEGRSYWNEELLTPEDMDWVCHQPHGMDVILAHDCPRGVNIPGIGPDSKPRGGQDVWPPDMLRGAAAHRTKMREIWDKHHPQVWAHGHYHVPYESWYGRTRFYGMDCDGASGGMNQNVMFLTAADLK